MRLILADRVQEINPHNLLHGQMTRENTFSTVETFDIAYIYQVLYIKTLCLHIRLRGLPQQIHRPGELEHQKCVFPVLEATSSRPRCWRGWFLLSAVRGGLQQASLPASGSLEDPFPQRWCSPSVFTLSSFNMCQSLCTNFPFL